MGTERFYPILKVKQGQDVIEKFGKHVEYISQSIEGVKENIKALANGNRSDIKKISRNATEEEKP